ncbi:LysR family transcriptional regulator [Ramlibacter sp.]|uniref:LysR family transcriptional regulator n=1 Tax=Ramlibacter sp. TaxID=1917967 RepID=UPI003D0C27EA
MKLDPADLRLFVAIAQHGNMTRGAADAHLSLTAASARVKAMESGAGVELLHREPRGVRLTAAGQAFLHRARAILRDFEALRAEMDDYSRGLRAQVRVHANTTGFTHILPEILPGLLTAHPRINLDLREHRNEEIAMAVLDRRADLGIVSARTELPGLRLIHFCSDRLVLVVPQAHPLAARESVLFSETLEHDYVGMHQGSTITEFLEMVAVGIGMPLRTRVHLSNFDTICRMIATGVGIGAIPANIAARNLLAHPLAQLELEDEWRKLERYVVVRDSESLPEFAQALVETLVAHYAQGTPATFER